MTAMTRLGEALAAARTTRGLTQEEVARRLGTRQANISQYETGFSVPPASRLHELARMFDVDPLELMKAHLEDAAAVVADETTATAERRTRNGPAPRGRSELERKVEWLEDQLATLTTRLAALEAELAGRDGARTTARPGRPARPSSSTDAKQPH